MRILFVLMFVLSLVATSFAATVPTYITGNTVSYCTVARLIDFDAPTEHIYFLNNSDRADCKIDLVCWYYDGNGSAYATGMTVTNTTITLAPCGVITPNVVELDFSTKKIGFQGDMDTEGTTLATVTYWATGNREF
ncbi:MAG: hypothetical protein KKA68_20945 [Gammaproteobacteria bacterium]|nr:hypothetical protein [Gammaproteobacteria bacterium]